MTLHEESPLGARVFPLERLLCCFPSAKIDIMCIKVTLHNSPYLRNGLIKRALNTMSHPSKELEYVSLQLRAVMDENPALSLVCMPNIAKI